MVLVTATRSYPFPASLGGGEVAASISRWIEVLRAFFHLGGVFCRTTNGLVRVVFRARLGVCLFGSSSILSAHSQRFVVERGFAGGILFLCGLLFLGGAGEVEATTTQKNNYF